MNDTGGRRVHRRPSVFLDGTDERTGPVKEYTVLIGGIEHTMQLDDADAKRLGAKQAETKQAETKKSTPSNKARTPANK